MQALIRLGHNLQPLTLPVHHGFPPILQRPEQDQVGQRLLQLLLDDPGHGPRPEGSLGWGWTFVPGSVDCQ